MDISSKLHGLDLFSGIGGLSLALDPWVRTVAYCENNRYAQAVLLSRMHDGSLHRAPIWDDITTLSGLPFRGAIDFVFGGFPCQDISVAGHGVGLEGKRSGLFFEVHRLVTEVQPAFVFLENVPAIRTRGGERVVKELASLGYDCRWITLSAAEVGAPHKRERWFLLAVRRDALVAHADGVRELQSERSVGDQRGRLGDGGPPSLADSPVFRRREECPVVGGVDFGGEPEGLGRSGSPLRSDGQREMADANCPGLEGWSEHRQHPGERALRTGRRPVPSDWSVEPNVGRVAHGVPSRVDRLRCLGNSVVPAQAREAFCHLMGIAC